MMHGETTLSSTMLVRLQRLRSMEQTCFHVATQMLLVTDSHETQEDTDNNENACAGVETSIVAPAC